MEHSDENARENIEVTVDACSEPKAKSAKDRKRGKDKVKPLAKVVIRRLPPTMTEDCLVKQIEPIPEHDCFYFVPADWSLGQHATSRAYINFRHQSDIFIFKDKFDGYVFIDSKGTEYPAIVEFAPFQGLPKGKSRKRDNKANSIETEAHYLSFVETLKDNENESKGEMKMEYSFQLKDDEKITSTPLLEYIAYVKQGHREERKRKIEDRKRAREDEKLRKKNVLAKSIPKAIEEEQKEEDDGIVVRTVKSRLDRGKKNATDDIERPNRAEREKKDTAKHSEQQKQKERRDNKRKEERERRKVLEKGKNGDSEATEDRGDGKEKLKTYSESRRERRSKAEQLRANTNSESLPKTSAEPDPHNQEKFEITKSTGEGQSHSSREEKCKSRSESNREKKDRSIQSIRNKDRPSLQIYQPSKRRADSSGDAKSAHADSIACEMPKDGELSSDKTLVEKKVSRYSERRNKARERRSIDDKEKEDSKE